MSRSGGGLQFDLRGATRSGYLEDQRSRRRSGVFGVQLRFGSPSVLHHLHGLGTVRGDGTTRHCLDFGDDYLVVTRRDAAAVLYRELGYPVSPRTLEGWPLSVMVIGGRATFDTAELLAFARARIAAVPVQRSGRTRT